MTTSANFARPSCLDKIISKAEVSRRDLRKSSSNDVKPTIFMPGSMPRRTDAASAPSIFGMLTSRITSAGARSLAFSIAATPSPASQQALKGVARSMNWQMASRTAALSSTTRIHGVRGDGIAEETTSLPCLGQYEFSLVLASDFGGGLNGSTQHSVRTQLILKTKAESLAGVRSAGTLPWLGFDRAQPNRSLLSGKHCRINSLDGVASTV